MRSAVQICPDLPLHGSAVEYGAIAQLGERLPCTQEVSGSIPLGSTILTASKLRNEYSDRILISELFQNRSLKFWVCVRKIDWATLSLVCVQAKVKFVSDS